MYPLAKIQIYIFVCENDDCPNQMLDKKPFGETKMAVCFIVTPGHVTNNSNDARWGNSFFRILHFVDKRIGKHRQNHEEALWLNYNANCLSLR